MSAELAILAALAVVVVVETKRAQAKAAGAAFASDAYAFAGGAIHAFGDAAGDSIAAVGQAAQGFADVLF